MESYSIVDDNMPTANTEHGVQSTAYNDPDDVRSILYGARVGVQTTA